MKKLCVELFVKIAVFLVGIPTGYIKLLAYLRFLCVPRTSFPVAAHSAGWILTWESSLQESWGESWHTNIVPPVQKARSLPGKSMAHLPACWCMVRVLCALYGDCLMHMRLVICFWASFQLRKKELITTQYTAELKNKPNCKQCWLSFSAANANLKHKEKKPLF